MTNILTGILIITILGLSISKIIHEKHKGSVCIGCPYSGSKDGACACKVVAFSEEPHPL